MKTSLRTLFLAIMLANRIAFAGFDSFDSFDMDMNPNRRNLIELDFGNSFQRPKNHRFHCRNNLVDLLSATSDEFSNLRSLPPLKDALSQIQEAFSKSSGNDLRIQEELGHGAFGYVYKLVNSSQSQLEAVKLIYSTEAFSRRSLKNEYTILKNLDHPNIPKVYEFINLPLTSMRMEFIEGRTLKERLMTFKSLKPRSELFDKEREKLLKIYDELKLTLMYLRSQSVVHNDFHSGNIIITPLDKPYLVDFGVAKYDYHSPNSPSRDMNSLNDVFESVLYPNILK